MPIIIYQLVPKRNLSRSQLHYGSFIHPPHFKTLKIHSCRSPIFHCLCSHLNHFIFHHYYIMTSHILSTSEFHVGSIFHYDSSQSFILYSYWMMWNSLRSTFQWYCPIYSDIFSLGEWFLTFFMHIDFYSFIACKNVEIYLRIS